MTFADKMFNWEESEYAILFITITLSYLIAMISLDVFEYATNRHTFILKIKSKEIQIGILTAMFMTTLIYMFQANALPFIYFQF